MVTEFWNGANVNLIACRLTERRSQVGNGSRYNSVTWITVSPNGIQQHVARDSGAIRINQYQQYMQRLGRESLFLAAAPQYAEIGVQNPVAHSDRFAALTNNTQILFRGLAFQYRILFRSFLSGHQPRIFAR